jgi:uncharacterized protein
VTALPASEKAVVFRCGDAQLVGVLHRAAVERTPIGVLVVVGGPQYRVGSHRQFVLMARALAECGYPVLRFDYRGMGDSEGEARSFENVSADIRAAIDTLLTEQPHLSGVVLWGLCDAASAILLYGAHDRRVCGLVLANPWVRTEASEAQTYLRHYYGQRLLQRSFWRAVFSGGFRPLRSARDLLKKIATARNTAESQGSAPGSFVERMRRGLAALDVPLLVLISERDLTAQAFVDLCSADPMWRSAMSAPNVSVVRLQAADHTFSGAAALRSATEACLQWLRNVPSQGG